MRYFILRSLRTAICLALPVLLTSSAWADDEPKNEDRAGRRAGMRQKMLEEFDADGDGELNDDERTNAREAMRSRRGDRAKGGKAKGGKAKGGKAKGGPGRRGAGKPDPAKLFDKYDANGDGQLSRAEFMKLTEEVRPPRPPRVSDRRGGPRRGGPPQEGKRRFDFDRDRPLQNPGDRRGPPPRGEGRRRLNDEEGSGKRGPQARGPGARGHQGHGPPNPEEVFDRFDENGDDQLSREEFMKLADKMRERHGRGGEHGMRGGRGSRRGGPPGGDGPSGRRRPPRPESGAGPEFSPTDDNSV